MHSGEMSWRVKIAWAVYIILTRNSGGAHTARMAWHAGHWEVGLCDMQDTEESDFVACRTLRSQTMWHAGHWGVGLRGMQDTEESDFVACRTLRSWTMWHVGHWGVRLCGMQDTEESDYVAFRTLRRWTLWQAGHWGVRQWLTLALVLKARIRSPSYIWSN